MNLSLGDKYQLRQYDARNFRLYKYREVEETYPGSLRKTGTTRMDWMPMDCYTQTVEFGIECAIRDALINEPGETASLRESLDVVRAVSRGVSEGIMAHLAKREGIDQPSRHTD